MRRPCEKWEINPTFRRTKAVPIDSKFVNKLIRSEIWPLLRDQGFSVFDSRNAFRYRPMVIDVVNFQSFNTHLASILGCTTYSFGLNLGVYVLGNTRESRIRRNRKGMLLPREYECPFRAQLKKRSPVDGFARKDIFSIDPDGCSADACFAEVRHLLTNVAPCWFEECSRVDRVIAWMEGTATESENLPRGYGYGTSAARHSYASNKLLAALRIAVHNTNPTTESRKRALQAIEQTTGVVFDFGPILNESFLAERKVVAIRDLSQRLGFPEAFPAQSRGDLEPSSFPSPAWFSPGLDCAGDKTVPSSREFKREVKEKVWCFLKREGFSDFTTRMAHRTSPGAVEVVEIVRFDSGLMRRLRLPDGIFHVGLGMYWRQFPDQRNISRNRYREPRPKLKECHLMIWLVPNPVRFSSVRNGFGSVSDVESPLATEGLRWLSFFRDPGLAYTFLKKDDWEIFCKYPLMRGMGSKTSLKRYLILAFLAQRLGLNGDARKFLRQAEAAIERSPKHLKQRDQKQFNHFRSLFQPPSGD